jgi:hypothetical protein
MTTLHVTPINDLIEHEAVGTECVCGPQERPEKAEDGSINWICVHNSLDGRELAEEDRHG